MKKFFIVFSALSLAVSSALVFECFFDHDMFFDEIKMQYTCALPDGKDHPDKVRYTNSTHRDITNVTGTHLAKYDNSNITQIHIFKHKFEYFPRGMNDFFENIIAIHAGMNGLAFLEKDDMRVFDKLRFLYLYNNVLQTLTSDVFEENLQLEYVSFYGNLLKQIGSNILTPLKSIKTAYFNKNICIDKQAVHNLREIAEIKLEIAQSCSNITDEDLMTVLKKNQEKLTNLEEKMMQLSEQLNEFISSNRTEL